MTHQQLLPILSPLHLLASPNASVGPALLKDKLEDTLQRIVSSHVLPPPITSLIADKTKRIQQRYTHLCIFFLLELREFLVSHPADDTQVHQRLSIQSQVVIKTVIEIIVYWGLCPHLSKGVGLSLALRSKVAVLLEVETEIEDSHPSNYEENSRKLFEYIRSLLLLRESAELAPIILSRNLPDIFAGLVQLLHDPAMYGKITNEELELCETSIHSLIEQVNSSLVVEALSMGLSAQEAGEWYRLALGKYLSYALMRPHALQVVLDRVLGSERAKGSPAAFNQVVRLVAACPSFLSIEEYYSKICPQILPLLHNNPQNPEYLRQASVLIAGKMLELQPVYAKQYLFDPLLAPLYFTLSSPSGEGIDEATLSQCIEDVHRLISSLSLSHQFMDILSSVVSTIFHLHLFTNKTKSYLKTAIQEILVSFFRYSPHAVSVLKELILPQKFDITTGNSGEQCMGFAPGPTGGVVIQWVSSPERDFAEEAKALVALLMEMKNDRLAGDLFVDLLSEFLASKPSKPSKYVFEEENLWNDSTPINSHNRYFVLLETVAIIGDSMGASVLKNVTQVCTLLRILLTHEDLETLNLSLGLVLTLLSGAIKVSKEEEVLIYDLLPYLDQLINHLDNQVAEMAAHAKTLIITSDTEWKNTDKSIHSQDTNINNEIKQILVDVRNPLLPIRAHGLISLRKLVLRKDPAIQKHVSKLLDIFWSQMNDEDSYIYQSAINGVAALGDIYPNDIIPKLAKQFSNATLRNEIRLKLGEALLQVAARCGEVLPKYGNYFVHSFLESVKDGQPDIRASCLSLLASVCQLMRFALHPYIQEILMVVDSVLATDKEAIVRRGGIYVFKELLSSMGKHIFTLVPEEMKNIYRRLRVVEHYDTDDLCKYQARAVLLELDEIIKGEMFTDFHSSLQSHPRLIQEME